jgi:hypothetical protein
MPVYNGGKYIAAALDSVQKQADSIEMIVIDDGSSDQSLDIVHQYESRMPLQVLSPGRMGSWIEVTNLGLQRCSGEWVCFLHADDMWLPGRIACLRRELDSSCHMMLHNASFVSPQGNYLGAWSCPLPNGTVCSEEFLEHLLVQNFIAICSPLFRRETATKLGGLDPTLWHTADWDLWLKLGLQGPVRFIPETLGAFRIHPEAQTVARRLGPGEWNQQLTTVFDRYFPLWSGTGNKREAVQRVARVSFSVNSALAMAARGESLRWGTPLLEFSKLGPLGWSRYLRDSRIFERVRSRLKLQRAGWRNPAAE